MARLERNKPLTTRESSLKIDGLKAGKYRIQLRVFDDTGNISRPDIVTVDVKTVIRGRVVTDTRTNRSNVVVNNRLIRNNNR